MWPVGLARGRPCLAVLCGWGCSRLGAAVQSMSPMLGVGGLRGLGCRQLLRGGLVGHAFFHARDWGLVEEVGAEGRRRAPCAGSYTVPTVTASLSSQACAMTLPHQTALGTQSDSLRNRASVPTPHSSDSELLSSGPQL